MPIFEVEAPDGSTLEIEAPEGATEEQVLRFASQQYKPKKVEEPKGDPRWIRPPEEVIPEFASGVIQGGKELMSGLTQTVFDLAGKGMPENEIVQQIREIIPDAVKRSRQEFERKQGDSIPAQVGEFAGQVAPFVALAPAAPAALAGRVALGAAGGALAGATAPTAEQLTPDEALEQRGEGAALGGAIGGVIPGVTPAAISAAKGVAGGVSRLAKGRTADQILSARISATDASKALSELKGGQISVLADVAGDEIKGLTRIVGKTPGGARNIVTEALEGRAEDATRRVVNDLTKSISNVDTYFGQLDDIAKARAEVARPLYAKAFSEAREINRDKLNKLLQDKRIIDAIDDAKANLGVRVEAPANSLETLDGAKKSLDDIIGKAKRAGENQKAASYLKLKGQLLEELDTASPTYGKARKVFSDFSSLQDAQEVGLAFTKQTPEQLKRYLSTLDNSQKEAFKIGVRENLQRVVNKTADQADPAKRVFGNTFKREQLKAIFGEGKQFDSFAKRMNEEIRGAKTKFDVLGGSRTDINLADDGQFIEAAAQAARQGVALTALEKTVGAITGAAKRRYIGITPENAKRLAVILTDKNAGIDALENLIKRAPKGQKAILEEAIKELSPGLGITAAIGAR